MINKINKGNLGKTRKTKKSRSKSMGLESHEIHIDEANDFVSFYPTVISSFVNPLTVLKKLVVMSFVISVINSQQNK